MSDSLIIDCGTGEVAVQSYTAADIANQQAMAAAAQQQAEALALQEQALQNFLQLIPNLSPALAQAQTDAAAYPTAAPADQAAIVVRLVGNVAMLAEACSYAFTRLGLIPA